MLGSTEDETNKVIVSLMPRNTVLLYPAYLLMGNTEITFLLKSLKVLLVSRIKVHEISHCVEHIYIYFYVDYVKAIMLRVRSTCIYQILFSILIITDVLFLQSLKLEGFVQIELIHWVFGCTFSKIR